MPCMKPVMMNTDIGSANATEVGTSTHTVSYSPVLIAIWNTGIIVT